MLRRLGLAAGALWIFQLIQPAAALQPAGSGACNVAADGNVAAAGVAGRCGAVVRSTSSTIAPSKKKRLELVLIDAAKLSGNVTAALQNEVVAVFGEAGVDASFSPGAAPPGSSDTTIRLKVIVLAEDGKRFGVDGTRMGATLMVPGRACDTAYVFLPVVLSALDSRVQRVESMSATRLIASRNSPSFVMASSSDHSAGPIDAGPISSNSATAEASSRRFSSLPIASIDRSERSMSR